MKLGNIGVVHAISDRRMGGKIYNLIGYSHTKANALKAAKYYRKRHWKVRTYKFRDGLYGTYIF